MARCDIDFPASLTRMMENLMDESLCKELLEKTTPIMTKAVIKRANGHRVSGDMLRAIKATAPKKNAYGWFTVVRPTGKDKNGVRNMEKMAYLEYGAVHHGQPATPVMAPAVKDCTDEVLNAMQDEFERIVNK